jgi:hypothetical protein
LEITVVNRKMAFLVDFYGKVWYFCSGGNSRKNGKFLGHLRAVCNGVGRKRESLAEGLERILIQAARS